MDIPPPLPYPTVIPEPGFENKIYNELSNEYKPFIAERIYLLIGDFKFDIFGIKIINDKFFKKYLLTNYTAPAPIKPVVIKSILQIEPL